MGAKGATGERDEGHDFADMVEAGMRAQKKARLLEQVLLVTHPVTTPYDSQYYTHYLHAF